ncbi:MAG: hypothetical protein WED10_06290 [Brumimicrobium sp.]
MQEVRKIISEIEGKIAKMRSSMENVKTENVALKSEIDLLAEKLKKREMEANDFREKYDELMQRTEIEAPQSSNSGEQNAQIDALVREIDDCIGRLKQ